jgi:cytochrome c556
VFAAPEAEPEDIIKYRVSVMKANGALMGASGAIVQGKVGYKGNLADHARALEAINRDVAALFPKGSDFGDTKALDAVWSKRAQFEKRAQESAKAASAFAKTAATGDLKAAGAAFKTLSDTCKGCHKDFRKEEK